MKQKTIAQIEVIEKTKNGGRITISTGAVDRDRDRVIPSGAQIDDYLKHPVVQWGHNYSDPWATVGKTSRLEISDRGIVAEFELREPVNDSDPMHVIRSLWDSGLIKTASIGFNPLEFEENDAGGFDFTNWQLLEWSLVPIPANQEALRLAVKAVSDGPAVVIDGEEFVTDATEPAEVEVVEDEPVDDAPEPEPLETEASAEDDGNDELMARLAPALSVFLSNIQEILDAENG